MIQTMHDVILITGYSFNLSEVHLKVFYIPGK